MPMMMRCIFGSLSGLSPWTPPARPWHIGRRDQGLFNSADAGKKGGSPDQVWLNTLKEGGRFITL